MSGTRPDPALVRQAIAWLVETRSGEMTPRQHAQLQQWRQASAQHEAAWQAVASAVGRSVHALAQQPLAQQQAAMGALVRPRRRRMVSGSLAVAGLLAATGWIADRRAPLSGWLADAHTATAQRRTLQLPDGSQLLLAPRTVADLDFTAGQRRVHLRQGELIATAAPDGVRPFVVATAQGEVQGEVQAEAQGEAQGEAQPPGARYMVRQLPQRTLVAALRHGVALRSHGGGDQALEEGRCAWITQDGSIHGDDRGAGEAAAWQHGLLLAQDQPLGEVIAALRPYRAGLLRISPEAARIRVLGAFPLDDTDRALQALADTLPIRVQRYTGGWLTTIDA